MSLRLLAMFNMNVASSGKEETPVIVQATLNTWWPGVGLIAHWSEQVFSGIWYAVPLGVMTLDGRFCDRSEETLIAWGWWPAKNTFVFWDSFFMGDDVQGHWYDDVEFVLEPIMFTPDHVSPPPYATHPSGGATHPLDGRYHAKLADRSIFYDGQYGSGPSFRVVVDNVEVAREGPERIFEGGARLHPGRSETEVFVGGYGSTYDHITQGAFYDTVTKQWSSQVFTIGVPARGTLIYVPEYGVLVSDHSYVVDPTLEGKSSQIRIWSLEVEPTILTPPEVVEGEVKSGQVVQYRVRLMGDHDDGAEGELVDWSIALGSAGSLLEVQSKTDRDGYATTRVQYDIGEVGESVVEASLRC